MEEYRRQIAYLYAYDQGEQVKNAGFVKAEVRGGRCRLGIHLKGYCHRGEDAGSAYIYFYHQGRTIGIYLGELKSQNGALEWQGLTRTISRRKMCVSRKPEESGSDVRADRNMWRTGRMPRWMSAIFFHTRGAGRSASAVQSSEAAKGVWRMSPTKDEKYMKEAIRQARKAWKLTEVPIGCVIVKEDKIIARGYNRRNTDKNTLAHAELLAIRKASKAAGDWRLDDCTMYITLEPCQMCAGAIVQARIRRVVIGSRNPKAGCAGSILNLLDVPAFNHQVELTEGVLEEECSAMLTDFFRELREHRKKPLTKG